MRMYQAVLLVSVLLATRALGATIHVPADHPTIQEAIDAAAPGDLILVAPGTYAGAGNKEITFRGKDVILRSEAGPEATTIDCEGSGRAFHLISGETNAAVIEGFTITGGRTAYGGGAIRLVSSSVTIQGCTIVGNAIVQPDNYGAAILAKFSRNSPVRISACRISGNTSIDTAFWWPVAVEGQGSDIRIEDCDIVDNGPFCGGVASRANSDVRLDRCRVSRNTLDGLTAYQSILIAHDTDVEGNTHYGVAGDDLQLVDCLVARNGWWGLSIGDANLERCRIEGNASGGIEILADWVNVYVWECSIAGNSGPGIFLGGGGIQVLDTKITGNRAERGAGIYFRRDSWVPSNIVGSTIASNSAGEGGGIYVEYAGPIQFEHSIVWGNCAAQGRDIWVEAGFEVTLECCDVDMEGVGGPGSVIQIGENFSADPLFCGPIDCIEAPSADGAYTLDANSPCLPENGPESCSQIGAEGLGCGAVAARSSSWGQIKARYR